MKPGGVLVLGLDGGAQGILGPLTSLGLMPRTAQLLQQGRSGVLASTLPWYTIPGWASMNTGVAPERHGLLHWVISDPSEYFENRKRGRRFVRSTDLVQPTYWDVAGAAGRRVAVLNMPMTYPAWQVNGTMVAGFLTPADAPAGITWPEGVLDAFPGYRIEPASSFGGEPEGAAVDLGAYLDDLVAITEERGRVAQALLADPALDLGVVVFVGIDRLAHKAWPQLQATLEGRIDPGVEAYVRSLDTAIGRSLDAAGDVTVLVVSDHGFGPPPPRTFAVNAWLREAGYLRVRAARAQQAVAKSRRVRQLIGKSVRKVRRSHAGEYAGVDWSASTAYGVRFPRTRMFGVVVNRAGVKRQGVVTEDEVPAVLERLRADLDALHDDAGRAVVRAVHAPSDPVVPGFPDLLVETEQAFDPIDGFRNAELFGDFDEPSGLHERDGVLAATGGTVHGEGPLQADIVDVAPTVLGLLGIETPSGMEGRRLDEVVRIGACEPAPERVRTARGEEDELTADQEAEIGAHLEALGYLD